MLFFFFLTKKRQNPSLFSLGILAKKTQGFYFSVLEECIKKAIFAAYVNNPQLPKLEGAHIMDAIANTVPLSVTMKEQITSLRHWASTRAKNASMNYTIEPKEQTILLTRPELELERSFDLTSK